MAVTMSILRSMAARGVVLLSHSQGIKDGDLILADDLKQHLAKGTSRLRVSKNPSKSM